MSKTYIQFADEKKDTCYVRSELASSFERFYERECSKGEKIDDVYWRYLTQDRHYAITHTRQARIRERRRHLKSDEQIRGKTNGRDYISDADIEYDLAEDVVISIISSRQRYKERADERERLEAQRERASVLHAARDAMFKSLLHLIELSKLRAEVGDHSTKAGEFTEQILVTIDEILDTKERAGLTEAEFNMPFQGGLGILDLYINALTSMPSAISYTVVHKLSLDGATIAATRDQIPTYIQNLANSFFADARTASSLKTRSIIDELKRLGVAIYQDPETREPKAINTEAFEILEREWIKQAMLEQKRIEQEMLEKERKEQARLEAIAHRETAERLAAETELRRAQEEQSRLRVKTPPIDRTRERRHSIVSLFSRSKSKNSDAVEDKKVPEDGAGVVPSLRLPNLREQATMKAKPTKTRQRDKSYRL